MINLKVSMTGLAIAHGGPVASLDPEMTDGEHTGFAPVWRSGIMPLDQGHLSDIQSAIAIAVSTLCYSAAAMESQ
jgi:hypothetical protein